MLKQPLAKDIFKQRTGLQGSGLGKPGAAQGVHFPVSSLCLSVISLVLAELKGRGCKNCNEEPGNRVRSWRCGFSFTSSSAVLPRCKGWWDGEAAGMRALSPAVTSASGSVVGAQWGGSCSWLLRGFLISGTSVGLGFLVRTEHK